MTSHFLSLLFTPAVKAAQQESGSRQAYSRFDVPQPDPDQLTAMEAKFISDRDSFYMATVSADGWPYIQHRGGPKGFVKVINDRTFAMADYRGNRQYVSIGNLNGDSRAALFFMDYAQRRRLKILARARTINFAEAPEFAASIIDAHYDAKVERGMLFEVEAFDWNCSQHITPRFAQSEIFPGVDGQKNRISDA